MPVYEYKCLNHGVFYELATMDASHEPAPCPACGSLSGRIICIAPEILDMSPAKRKAYATNEKSQHEPAFSSAERRQDDEEHAKGCGCQKSLGKSKLLYTAEGDKMFPSMRPWMISH